MKKTTKTNWYTKSVKPVIGKIKKSLKYFWFKHVTKARLERKKKLAQEQEIKNIHKNFETRFGVSAKKVKEQMIQLDNGYKKLSQTDGNYLREKLIEGRRSVNQACYVPPTLYDPEMISIHNEYVAKLNEAKDLKTVTLNELIAKDCQESKDLLQKQADKIRFNTLKPTTKEKLKSILRPR